MTLVRALVLQQALAEEYAAHDWQALTAPGAKQSLSSLTVPTLKVYLQHNGLRLTGNKAELIQRIQDHLRAAGSG